MITNIYYSNGYHNIDPNKAPTSFRQLRAFLQANNLFGSDIFHKSSGQVIMLTFDSKIQVVCKTLTDLSFTDYYNLALKQSQQYSTMSQIINTKELCFKSYTDVRTWIDYIQQRFNFSMFVERIVTLTDKVVLCIKYAFPPTKTRKRK